MLVVLYVGRLSFHAKAHPLAMYQALETAAQNTGKKVLLIECGWHANDYIKMAFVDAAKQVSPLHISGNLRRAKSRSSGDCLGCS